MTAIRILTFFYLLCSATSTEEHPDNKTDNRNNPNTQVSEPPQPQQPYPVTWNSYNVMATTTAAVVVAAGIAALAALVAPLITYKICYLLGSCEDGFFTYVDRFIASDAAEGQRKNTQKLSLEHLGPILQTLVAAYEKYGSPEIKKKSKMSASYGGSLF